MANYSSIGKDVKNVNAFDKVTGRAIYTVSMKLPALLYGKILWSQYPHAKILDIDIFKALKLPGVKAVVTGKDFQGLYGSNIQDQPVFAIDRVRYMGEAVAGVAATDEEIAEDALSLISVEYETLPAVFDPLEAMKPDAVLIHERLHEYQFSSVFKPIKGTNICSHFKLRKGDVEKGFRESEAVFQDQFRTQMVQHCTMEPYATIVKVDLSGNIKIWGSIQSPFYSRTQLAQLFHLPAHKIVIEVPYIGGGFGSKHALNIEPICVLLAQRTNQRPVRIVLSRQEMFVSGKVRHPTIIDVKTGVKKDGTLVARQIKLIWDTGAYTDVGGAVSRNAGFSSAGPYRIEHVAIDSYCVYTNKQIAGAFRGLGIPQVTWAHEQQMDIIAETLGIDPLEIRLRNAAEDGSESATGEILQSVSTKETLRKVAELIEWGEERKEKGRGKDIATMHKSTSTPSSSAAFIQVNADGTVGILSSAVDMGQGSNTVLIQIVAEVLGVNPQDIYIATLPNTEITPYDWGTVSSRATFSMGNAVRMAALDARKQILDHVSEALEEDVEDLDIQDGKVFVKKARDRYIKISELDHGIYAGQGGPILGRGVFTTKSYYIPLNEQGLSKKPTAFWIYASQGAEVKIDIETGTVKVLRLVGVHDAGRVINPLGCEGQIAGALIMGLGTTLTEEVILNDGKTVNPNFRDYKVLTALDIPELLCCLVEVPHQEGPFGAKGLGEPGLGPTAAAIANAIYDAIGVRIKDLPITPEKILKALREKEKA